MSLEQSNLMCRVCMNEHEDMTWIFAPEIFSGQELEVKEVMTQCASVQILKSDGLPQYICTRCVGNLQQAFAFKIQCEKSDYKLRHGSEDYELEIKHEPDNGDESIVKNELPQHVEQIWVDESDNGCNYDININENYNTETCGSCGKVYPGKCRRVRLAEDPYECSECRQTSKKKLCGCTTCSVNPGSQHVCQQCGKRLNDNNCKSCEATRKYYQCKTCHKRFSSASALSTHKKKHAGVKPYKCRVCEKSYSDLSTFNRHKKTHSGGATVKCGACGKRFANEVTLKVHMRMHTGEMPYKCEFCDRSFTHGNSFIKHRTSHSEQFLSQDASHKL